MLALVIFVQAIATGAYAIDTDGDLIDDATDNCTASKNPSQSDSDLDGFGNACDADFDQTGMVTINDFNIFRGCLIQQTLTGNYLEICDLNSDGALNDADYAKFRRSFGKPPGPTAIK